MKNVLLIITSFFITLSLAGQTGTVRGLVTDAITGETVPFANIYVQEIAGGTSTDLDGNYNINLDYGTYTFTFSFVGYSDFTVNDVIVSDKVNIIDVQFSEQGQLIEELVVTAKQARNTAAALATIKRRSPNLLDGVSSQTFKSIGDGDAGEAIKRVTGVSVEDGKHVYVRGLGDRYTKTMLNGMNIPGLDPDRNTVQMDIFPTNVIDNILVFKSFSPDLPADFSGGIVDIITKDFPDKFTLDITGSVGYNSFANLNENFLSYDGGKTDWLAMDDGTRKLKLASTTIIPNEIEDSPVLSAYTSAFSPTMAARPEMSELNRSFAISTGNQKNIGMNSIGYIAALNYNQGFKFYDDAQFKSYVAEERSNFDLDLDRSSAGLLSEKETLVSALVGTSFKTKNHRFSLNALRIQKAEDQAAKLIVDGGEDNPSIIYKDILQYAERTVTNLNLDAKHSFNKGKFEISWTLSPTWVEVDEPDIRSAGFELLDGEFLIQPSVGADVSRTFRNLKETSYNGKIDLVYNLKQWAGLDAKIKTGFNYLSKERDFGIQNYVFRTKSQNSLNLDGNPDNLFLPENIWTPENSGGVYVVGNFEHANNFNATQDVLAGYAMTEMPINDKLKAITGLRVEQAVNHYTGTNNQQTIVYANKKVLDDLDLLPSANLVYSFTDKMNLRLSYNSTLVRPSFKEKSIAQIQDFISGRTFIGNIDLERSYIQNFDLRWENFYDNGGLISISGFHKRFKNPIELVSYNELSPDNFTPRNFDGIGTVSGVEIEVKKSLDVISSALSDINFGVNASVISSKINRDSRVDLYSSDTRPMAGQSPYLINASLGYRNAENGWEMSTGYNVQGKRLSIVGIGVNPDVYEQSFHALDAKITKSLNENKYRLSLSANNILQSKRKFTYDGGAINTGEFIWAYYNPGTTYNVSFSASLN